MALMTLEKWLNLDPRPPIKRIFIGEIIEEIDFKNQNNKQRAVRKEPIRTHETICGYCKEKFLGLAHQKYCKDQCRIDAYNKSRRKERILNNQLMEALIHG